MSALKFQSLQDQSKGKMGKGRAPCCDKNKVKRGPWSPAEDMRLITFIQQHGHDNWRALPKQAGLLRCGKSCRLRWINYLRPDVKRGNFTKEEEDNIIKLHETFGNKWSKIASLLPGRTDNEIKNVWNTHLKKKVDAPTTKGVKSATTQANNNESSVITSSSSSSSTNSMVSSTSKRTAIQAGIEEDDGSSAAKEPRLDETEGVEEPKEVSNSSNSSSMTNYSSHVDVSTIENQDDEIGLLLGGLVEVPFDATNIFDEVNKPDIFDDFWINLDLDNIESNMATSNDVQSHKVQDETKKWLHYLENELGLESTVDVHQQNLTNLEAVELLIPDTDTYLTMPEFLLDNVIDPSEELWTQNLTI